MSMSKKHFIALAIVVRNCKPTLQLHTPGMEIDSANRQWVLMRNALADFCADQCPQFNRQRWLDYIAGECGPNGGKL